ncbi:MAG TPA: NeuD/PglB/VioB family sugar acetyltransferase [Cyclobacteriaceae bacterium]
MKQKLLLFPCNGNAIEALDCIGDQFEVIGFIDDDSSKIGQEVCGFKVFSRKAFNDFAYAKVLAVPGGPLSFMNRANIIEGLQLPSERFVQVIHKHASVSKRAQLGFNVLIMAGVVITSNAKIGNHVCILPNTVIHHDSVIQNYSLLGAGVVIAGNVTIEENCYIGSGSSVINNVTLGKGAMIGLGTNVIRDINPRTKNIGNPSRQIE